MREESSTPVRALYDVLEANGPVESESHADLRADHNSAACDCDAGPSAAVPADSISEYVQLPLTEAGGDDDRAA
jgi:hypothetical protein